MNIIDIILALVLISFILILINYILGLITLMPSCIVSFLTVGFFIAMFKFVIGR